MVTTSSEYITEAQLRMSIRDNSLLDATAIALAITAASRAVDAYCGRKFNQEDGTRFFSPSDLYVLDFDGDLANTTGLVVTADPGTTGTYNQTWTVNTDFILEPVNRTMSGINVWPYTRLRAVGGKTWPLKTTAYMRETVSVTGRWGWQSVPTAVEQATLVLASYMYKRPEAALGTTGMAEWGLMRVRDPDVGGLLKEYKKGSTLFIA